MYPSPRNLGMDDENWKSVFEILERSQQLPVEARRQFVACATHDPAVLKLLLELLEDESQAEYEIAPNQKGEPQPGERIGRYEILEKLGSGGTGQVYSARDLELGRLVAVKFLFHEFDPTQDSVDKLLREARAASALNHRHIVTIYEVIRSGERTAIAMEKLDGESLRSLCGQALPSLRAMHLGHQIATALSAAHHRGIVHRDIKPENVMVDHDDYVKVVDFSMARQIAIDASTTLHNAGTINYFSPEQARAERATSAGDIFSMGVVLYELATGTHPFHGETALETLHAISNLEPAPPLARNSRIPKRLNRLILDMLKKPAGLRPGADEVVAELSLLLREEQT